MHNFDTVKATDASLSIVDSELGQFLKMVHDRDHMIVGLLFFNFFIVVFDPLVSFVMNVVEVSKFDSQHAGHLYISYTLVAFEVLELFHHERNRKW